MTLLFAVALFVIALVVVGFYHAGANVPLSTTARLCLWEKVKAAGLAERVPASCVNEVADHCSAALGRIARRGGSEAVRARTLLLPRLDGAVRVIALHLAGAEVGAEPDAAVIVAILLKHGLDRGEEAPSLGPTT